jgi:MerR family transcriptional regulator/heat shock protein HspR
MQGTGDEPVYVISVAARLAGLPCWVLRVLDQEGIVVPVRTDSNRRLYSDNDIVLLARVHHLMVERKVNINGIKVILEMEQAQHSETTPTNEAHAMPNVYAEKMPTALPPYTNEPVLTKTNGSHS